MFFKYRWLKPPAITHNPCRGYPLSVQHFFIIPFFCSVCQIKNVVGLPRKANKTDPIGWEDVKNMPSDTMERKIMDDTMPEGPVERTIVYEAPFDRCDQEKDYEVVWEEFERRFGLLG